MRTNLSILPAICTLCLVACKSGNASGLNKNEAAQDSVIKFTLPAVPPMLTAPELRADFVVRHYWDNVNFADTNYIHHPEVTEQAWADYCNILNHVPLETAQEAMRKTIDRANASKKMFTYITGLADKYLYDPNSPVRNEEFYLPVLEAMIDSPLLEEIEKSRPKALWELAQKNRVGTKARNFKYTTATGAQGSLYQQQAEYTLLFFNNPGCHACAETIEALKNAPAINQLIEQKRLTVLAVYPDEELSEWRRHQNEFPKEWINGYDKKTVIKEQNLYDLKAIPTLYLLNKEKTVLLKDAAAQAVEKYLQMKSGK